jgi:hypothetical protein
MDSNLAAAIDVIIDPKGSSRGAAQVNRDLDSIIGRGQKVGAANDNMAGSFGRAGAGMRGAANDAGALGKMMDEVRGRAAGATPAVGGLIQSLMGMGPLAAIAGGVALAVGAIGAASIKAAAQTQSWLAQIETITKSTEKAKETYAALVQFGNSTPFDTGQSVQAFVKLRQMGLAATEERLRSFGNTASASGKSLNQMIEAVADAGTGEFERLKEFGIKTKTEGDKVTFTMAGVKTTVANNAVAITKYLEDIGNTKFGGAMAKQMDTLNGAFSGVSDNMRSMLSAIGEGALGTAVKEIAKSIANGIALITPFMASIGNFVGGIINGVGSILDGLGSLWAGFGGAEQANNDLSILTVSLNLLGQGAEVLGSAIGSVFSFIGTLVSSVAEMWRSSFGSLLGDLTAGFEAGGRSWGNSIVGILRAVKYVVGEMPKLFQVAVSDVMKMFRDMGNGIMAFLSGDWKKGIELFNKPQLVSTRKAAGAIGTGAYATYRDESGADAAIGRLLGRGGKAKLDTGIDSTPDKPGSKDKDKNKGKSEAEKLAEKINEFWKKLEGDSKDAEATYKALSGAAAAGKNLATASADTAKQLEFQRLAGRDITDQEKERVATALQTQRTSKFLTDALLASDQRKYDLAEQQALLDGKRAGLTEGQLEIEKGVIAFRTKAQKDGINLQDAGYVLAEAKLRTDLASAQAITEQNKAYDAQKAKLKEMVESGKSVMEKYSAAAGLQKTLADLDKERAELNAYYSENKGKPGVEAAYKDAIKGITNAAADATTYFKTQWIDAIDQIASNFSGKFGEVLQGFGNMLQSLRQQGTSGDTSLFGGISKLFGGKVESGYNDQGRDNAAGLGSALSDPLKSLNTGFGDFKKMFTDPGQGGFASVLGKGLAKAGAGMEMGTHADALMKGLGLKSSKMGAQIGGGIGSLIGGPLGGLVGSIGGGLIGGAFKKAKYGTAVLNGSGDPTISGRGSAQKAAATGLAGSVQEGLASLAAELGGQLGKYAVSIGMYKDKYRVSTTGYGGKLGGKGNQTSSLGITDFGKDGEAAAIQFAIEDAIKDGAITGLAPIIQKALSGLGTESAIQFAKDWTAAMSDYKSLIDPVGAAIDAIIKPLDALKATMLQVGAGTEELAKFEDYRSKKLSAALKEQVSGFQSLLDQLNGDAGGVSDYQQLTTNLGKLGQFRSDIASGKTVDQTAYEGLANEIISKAGNVYGTGTTDYQDIVKLLQSTTTGAINNATKSFNSAAGVNADTVNAIQAQTNAYTAGQQQTNTLLADQNKLLAEQNSILSAKLGYAGNDNLAAVNARLVADW